MSNSKNRIRVVCRYIKSPEDESDGTLVFTCKLDDKGFIILDEDIRGTASEDDSGLEFSAVCTDYDEGKWKITWHDGSPLELLYELSGRMEVGKNFYRNPSDDKEWTYEIVRVDRLEQRSGSEGEQGSSSNLEDQDAGARQELDKLYINGDFKIGDEAWDVDKPDCYEVELREPFLKGGADIIDLPQCISIIVVLQQSGVFGWIQSKAYDQLWTYLRT